MSAQPAPYQDDEADPPTLRLLKIPTGSEADGAVEATEQSSRLTITMIRGLTGQNAGATTFTVWMHRTTARHDKGMLQERGIILLCIMAAHAEHLEVGSLHAPKVSSLTAINTPMAFTIRMPRGRTIPAADALSCLYADFVRSLRDFGFTVVTRQR